MDGFLLAAYACLIILLFAAFMAIRYILLEILDTLRFLLSAYERDNALEPPRLCVKMELELDNGGKRVRYLKVPAIAHSDLNGTGWVDDPKAAMVFTEVLAARSAQAFLLQFGVRTTIVYQKEQ